MRRTFEKRTIDLFFINGGRFVTPFDICLLALLILFKSKNAIEFWKCYFNANKELFIGRHLWNRCILAR